MHSVVALDNEWDDSPGSEYIAPNVSNNLHDNGWEPECFAVVIETELEARLWQDNPHVAEALRYCSGPALRVLLEQQGVWEATAVLPG